MVMLKYNSLLPCNNSFLAISIFFSFSCSFCILSIISIDFLSSCSIMVSLLQSRANAISATLKPLSRKYIILFKVEICSAEYIRYPVNESILAGFNKPVSS